MIWAKARLACALVFFISTCLAGVTRYKVPVWDRVDDPKLSDAFRAASRAKPWRLQYVKGYYALKKGDTASPYICAAFVLTEPLTINSRISRGSSLYFWKASESGDAWWPNQPYVWRDEPRLRRDYIIVKPPGAAPHPELVERIYNRPVYVEPEMDLDDAAGLIDTAYVALVAAVEKRDPPSGEETASIAFDENNRPDFEALSGLASRNSADSPAQSLPEGHWYVSLAQGGDGASLLEFQSAGGHAFRLVGVAGLSY